MHNRKNNAGISIVETVVALLILATIGGALMALNVQIQGLSNTSKFRSTAEAYAQKMIEQVRGRKNTLGGISGITDGCYTDGSLDTPNIIPTSSCNTPPGTNIPVVAGTNYKKYILISTSNGGKLLRSVVSWPEKGKTTYTEVNTYLYDY